MKPVDEMTTDELREELARREREKKQAEIPQPISNPEWSNLIKMAQERRDRFSKSVGWTVLRFTAQQVKEDVLKCILILKKLL